MIHILVCLIILDRMIDIGGWVGGLVNDPIIGSYDNPCIGSLVGLYIGPDIGLYDVLIDDMMDQ